MASRYLLVLPNRANRALLPALLVAVLAATALAQMLLTGDIDLPEGGAIGGGLASRGAPPDPGDAVVSPVIAARPIFAPRGAPAAGAGDAAPVDQLGGAVIAGSVRIGRLVYAVVQTPGGGAARVPIGGHINGWRLAALSDSAARLARGGELLSAAYGSHPATPAADANPPAEEGSQ